MRHRASNRPLALLGLALLLAMLAACGARRAASAGGYQTVAQPPHRQTELARRLSAEAAGLIEQGKLDEAEPLLKRALDADVTFGPAHNNLGKVYYHQGRLYLAAWEFQHAARLMPYLPEPKNNLGLVLERVASSTRRASITARRWRWSRTTRSCWATSPGRWCARETAASACASCWASW